MWIWAAPRIGKRFLESCKLSEEQTILKALPFKVYLSFRPLDGLCHQQICLHRRDRLRAPVFTMYVERFLEMAWFCALLGRGMLLCRSLSRTTWKPPRYRLRARVRFSLSGFLASCQPACFPPRRSTERTRKFIYLLNMLSDGKKKK